MDKNKCIDVAIKDLEDKQELIKFTDTKAYAALIVCSILMNDFFKIFEKIECVGLRYTLTLVFAFVALFSMGIILLKVLFPRNSGLWTRKGTVFHINIAKPKEEFIKDYTELSLENCLSDVISKICVLDNILANKSKHLKYALISLGIAIILFFVGIVFTMLKIE